MGLSLEKDSIFSGIKFFYDDLFFYRNTPMLASGIKGIRVQLRD